MIVNFDVLPFVQHIKPTKRYKTGATLVAFPMSTEGNVEYIDEARQVFISIAQCSERDQYSKKIGRTTATARAQEGEGLALRFPKHASTEQKREMILMLGQVIAGQLIY